MGYAGAGKTTVAKMLAARGYRIFALAMPIKVELERWLKRKPTKADRALMIEFGQSFRRWFGSSVWCRWTWECIEAERILDEDVRYQASPPEVVEDGRHLREYGFFVVERGFVPVRIMCDDETRFERLMRRDNVDQREVLTGKEDELNDVAVAYTIHNDGTMDELERQVDEMLREVAM